MSSLEPLQAGNTPLLADLAGKLLPEPAIVSVLAMLQQQAAKPSCVALYGLGS
jgi:hypothetical protein